MCIVLLTEAISLVLEPLLWTSSEKCTSAPGNKSLRKGLRSSAVITHSMYRKEGEMNTQRLITNYSEHWI